MSRIENDGHGHFCRLHHEDRELSEDVAGYVTEGLREGRAVVVVASAARRHHLMTHLQAASIPPDTARLTLIDSAALLATFMRDGEPDEASFHEALRPVIESALAAGTGAPRIYGEMVNDLWLAGNPQAAVRLEGLWNGLLREYRCELFCGYVLDVFEPHSYHFLLEEICRSHSHVSAMPREDRFRAAVDAACQHVLGVHLSTILSHSQLAQDKWHMRLPLSRRAILWLAGNMPSRLKQVLQFAKNTYREGAAEPARN